MARVKYCNARGCQVLVKAGKRYCEQHQPKFDIKRVIGDEKAQAVFRRMANKEYNENKRDDMGGFYNTSGWKQVRQFIVSRDMNTCQVCGDVIHDRKIVDHIHSAKLSPAERLSADNLWTLCYRCHSIKTEQEQALSEKGMIDVLKNASRDWWKFNIQHEIDRRKHTSQNRF